MNKRIAVLCFAVLLVATLCYAQGAREPEFPVLSNTGTTGFTSVAISGLETTRNPGFIMLKGVGQSAWNGTETDGTTNFVLWIDEDGDLCMASYTTISAYASFPSGDWDNDNMAICTKVGGQS